MVKRYSISFAATLTFAVLLVIFGSLSPLSERVEAGAPSCQEVNGMNRSPSGSPTPTPPPSGLSVKRDLGLPGGRLSQPGSSNLSGETPFRRTASAILSLMVLIGGLAGIAYSLKKLLPSRGSRNGQRHHLWGNPAKQRAFATALLIAALGASAIIGVVLQQAGSTSAETSIAAGKSRNKSKSKYQFTEAANDAPLFASALEIGSTSALWAQIGGTTVDSAGNTYITGVFNGSLTFNTPQQPTTLNGTRELDFFIAKLDPAGHTLWARCANGATNIATGFSLDGGLAVAVDAQGNAYVGGGFVNSLAFKDANGNTVATLGDNNTDINFELFIAKYSANGTLAWVRGGESEVADDPEAEEDLDAGINGITEIVVDNAGNPYVAGTFSGTNFLGQEIAPEGGRDVLLARLNPANGDPVWVSTPGSANTDAVMGMAIDAAANLYIIGDIGGTITFPTQPSETTFQLEDEFGDSFIAKYNQNGQVLWARQVGGTQPIDGMHIAANSAGQLYLTGAFEGTAEFDSITVSDQAEGTGSSGYLAKFTTNGNALWVRSFGHLAGETTEGDVLGYRVSVDGAGNPYVAGTFEGQAVFGEAPATPQMLISEGPGDQFVLHYDAAGNFRWVKQAVGSGIEGENAETGADIPIEVMAMRLVYNNAAKAMVMVGDLQGTLALDGFMLDSGSARHAFVATIPSCPAITLAPASLPNVTPGMAYNQTVTASPAGSYNYTITQGGLPAGLSLNSATGAISGSSTALGNYGFTVLATNADGCSGTQSYTLAVVCPAVAFNQMSLPAGQAGVAYSQSFTATPAPPAGSYSFSLIQGSLPSGVTFNSSTGVLGGTPMVTGAYNFTIKAAASNGCSGTQSYSLTINCPAITLNPATLPNGSTGTAYNQQLSATPSGSYTFALTGGALPNGLSLNPATGILSGTPASNGTFNFTITATGFGSCTGSRSYTITIGSGSCPAITLPSSLPAGSIGASYSQSVAASPYGNYSYTVTAGSLPPGVTLYGSFGLLYGYPASAGTFSFTIRATDSSGCSGSRNYTVVINGSLRSPAQQQSAGKQQKDE